MSDYIKRENAKRAVWGCTRDTGIDEAPFEYAEGLLEDVPAEDVEPVVRCKDCKCCHRFADDSNSNMKSWCLKFSLSKRVNDNDFCAWGERKDNE